MPKKKVLITGASGFIGRNVFEHLSKRDDLDVYGTYRTRKFSDHAKLLKVDLTTRQACQKVTKGFDAIIQAAATTSGAKDTINKPYYHVTDNAVINSLLFEAAHENNVGQVIFFSCTTMYPNLERPVTEEDVELSAIHDKYFGVAWMKLYIEKMCEFYSRLGRTKYTAIRHSNIYGPYDKYDLENSHVFGATITKVLTATDKVMVWGEGKEERDLLYISDLVDFVTNVLDRQDYDYDIFNLGLGQGISISDLVRKIIKHSGKNLAIEHDVSKPTIPTKLIVNIEKVKDKFGWKPQVNLDQGIIKTLDWYRKNIL
jgi:GDP-L-fucose synthase